MPISDSYERLPLNSIIVARGERQRRDLELNPGFLSSIKQRGVLNPIIVDRKRRLIAGERRLAASRELGLRDIPVRYLEDLRPAEAQLIELEENLKRQNLAWQDTCRAIGRIHNLYVELAGEAGWFQNQTAQALGLTESFISKCLLVLRHLDEERISNCATMVEATNVLSRRTARIQSEALEALFAAPSSPASTPALAAPAAATPEPAVAGLRGHPSPSETPPLIPPDPIEVADFLKWAPAYTSQRFNLIHCDFPYGIELFAGQQGRGAESTLYSDSQDVYFDLVKCLCENMDKLLSVSGHIMFWYSRRYEAQTIKIFEQMAPRVAWRPHPLIWMKTDNAGIAGDARRDFRHTYETCLVGSSGSRQLVGTKADSYGCPTDKRLHPSTKPEPMLRHFMEALVDETSRVLDPTAGSGAALRAAESLGAQQVLGLELNPEVARTSNSFYRSWRALKGGM